MFEIIETFYSWCGLKIGLHIAEREAPPFKQGEIWWCSVGMNVGGEIFGKGKYFRRPVLVLKKFSKNMFLGLPMTLQEKQGSWFVETELTGVRRWAILSQARTFDARRLESCVGRFDKNTADRIRTEFINLIGH